MEGDCEVWKGRMKGEREERLYFFYVGARVEPQAGNKANIHIQCTCS